jgi:intracellular sulfur oxidation DsrE/DsrF family protein
MTSIVQVSASPGQGGVETSTSWHQFRKTNMKPQKLKSIISLGSLFVAVMALGCSSVTAASGDNHSTIGAESEALERSGAVLGVRSEQHLEVALLTAEVATTGGMGYEVDHFVIALFGPGVPPLLERDDLVEEIAGLDAEKIDVLVCQITVDRLGIDEEALPESVRLVPNVFLEMLRLQSLGYDSLEI